MKTYKLLGAFGFATLALGFPIVYSSESNVTYHGSKRNHVEVFLGIKYGEDTSGQHRFKPPRPHTPTSGSVLKAHSYGPACPQPTNSLAPLALSNIKVVSEDCLNLNIVRPRHTTCESKLPVLVFIHGGDFFFNSNAEITNAPDGLIQRSVDNETPIIHVSLNYRLGAFGFAQSTALRSEGSENAGLRDQRLGIEWVRDNIEAFGGDPKKITIHGQSSGGLAVGLQALAYGGSKPVPYQQAICESQTLEPGITGNFTLVQMQLLAGATGCNTTDLQSAATVQCLRNLDTETMLEASIDTWSEDFEYNGGDSWLPVVDGDFLPAAPFQLLAEGRFANITTMILWCDADMAIYTPPDIVTAPDTFDLFRAYLPGMSNASIDALLALYPVSEFAPNPAANLTREFYRAAQVYRDVLMTCEPLGYGETLAAHGSTVYLIDQNATILDPILASVGSPGLGPVHTSEFAYTFGNLSHYNVSNYPFNPTAQDYRLEAEEAGTWAAFTYSGQPSIKGKKTLQGFEKAFMGNQTRVFVVGGDKEGLSDIDGERANPTLERQRLRERCGFLNSPDIVRQLQV